MNNQDLKIAGLLEASNIEFKSTFLGEQERSGGLCYAFTCTLAGEQFEYYKGLGHGLTPGEAYQHANKDRMSPQAVANRWLRQHGIDSKALRKKYVAGDAVSRTLVLKPTEAELIYSLISDASAAYESFGDWCEGLGYDEDSRKALDTYLACQENARKLRKALPQSVLAECEGVLEDY